MLKKSKKRARYGRGQLEQRGRIWWVNFRTGKRSPNGRYEQRRESTSSEDRTNAERFLRRKLVEVGGRRATGY